MVSVLKMVALAVLGALCFFPDLAHACAVCAPGREENRTAFIVTTGILTVLPPLMIGGVIFWLRAQFRAVDRAAAVAPATAVASRKPERTAGSRSSASARDVASVNA